CRALEARLHARVREANGRRAVRPPHLVRVRNLVTPLRRRAFGEHSRAEHREVVVELEGDRPHRCGVEAELHGQGACRSEGVRKLTPPPRHKNEELLDAESQRWTERRRGVGLKSSMADFPAAFPLRLSVSAAPLCPSFVLFFLFQQPDKK